MRFVKATVQSKILAALALVFVILMIATNWHMGASQRAMVADLAEQRARDTASSFFDGVNTMMLTGTMAQRELLRQKTMAHEDIVETRIIRAAPVVQLFGAGNPEQRVLDDLDRRALEGESIVAFGSDAAGRTVTVVQPIVATRDFRGTDCLSCHVAEEGAVLGATRVTYSLAALDRRIAATLLASGGLNVLLLIVGVVTILWLLRRIVIRPLGEMRATMGLIEADADLTRRLRVSSQDEIGALSGTCNQMLGHFGASLSEVSETSHRLSAMAERITGVSAKTAEAAQQQRAETDAVAAAIARLDGTSQEVQDGAASASNASVEADQAAAQGVATTRSAIDGIHAMLAELAQVSEVIERLDQRSQRVGDVLDVIKSIAEQTNLLALNAAIEAARAGDKGRGFAVVADEVRTLANRSHQSTSDIEEIIEHLQLGARDAVAAVRHATESGEARRAEVESAGLDLVRITEQVGRIRELNAGMASAAAGQRAVAHDVNRNVATISGLAERTAADAEEATSVSVDLQALAVRLEELVSRFRFSA